jgi:phage FluMu protein gp41
VPLQHPPTLLHQRFLPLQPLTRSRGPSRPSAVQTFAGRTIRIRAAAPLQAGDEVTISYLDLADPLATRQADLKERYLFRCACDVCSAAALGAPAAIPASERDKETVTGTAAQVAMAMDLADSALAVEEGRAVGAGGDLTPQARLARQLEAIGACRGVLHPRHIRLLRLREAASRLAIQLNDWRAAAVLVAELVDAYRHVYPPAWPVLGVQLALLGKIFLHLGREAEAVPVLREAISILDKTAGGGVGADKDQVLAQSEKLLQEAEWSLSGMGELA